MMMIDDTLRIAADKLGHFAYGALFALLALALWRLAAHLGWQAPVDPRLLAVAAALLLGLAKEYVYDARTGGDVSRADALATTLGGALLAVAITLAAGVA